jgi:hypothetical protein
MIWQVQHRATIYMMKAMKHTPTLDSAMKHTHLSTGNNLRK